MAAARYKVGTFVKQAATGTQTVDVGFQGKCLIVWTDNQSALGVSDKSRFGIGMTDGTSQVSRSIHHPDNEAATTSSQNESPTDLVDLVTANDGLSVPTHEVVGRFVAFTSTGFQINWTTNDGNATIFHYLVIGGGASAKLSIVHVPAAGSTVVTGIGFQSTGFIVLQGADGSGGGALNGYNLGAPFGSIHGLGFSNVTFNGCAWTLGRGTAGNSDNYRGLHADLAGSVRVANLAGAAALTNQAITAVSADGYTITKGTVSDQHFAYVMCLAGIQVATGSIAAPTTAGDYDLALGFDADVLLLETVNTTGAVGTAGLDLSLGAWQRNGASGGTWIGGTDNVGPSVYARATFTDAVLRGYAAAATGSASTLTTDITVTPIVDGTLRLTFNTAPATANPILYFAFVTSEDAGESTFSDGTVSHPVTFFNWHHDDGVHTGSDAPLPDRAEYYDGWKPANVVQWKPITRGLTDKAGQLEHQSFGVVLDDNDRTYRGMLDTDLTRYLPNRPFIERQIDDEERRLEGSPRMAANGFITTYEPLQDLLFSIECTGWLRKKFTRQRKSQNAWQPLFKVEDFDPNITPQDVLNRPCPVLYGRLSDADQQTVADTDASTGYLAKPTGMSGVVTGAPGTTTTWRYYFTSMNGEYESDPQIMPWSDHRGETDATSTDVAGAPDEAAFKSQAASGTANYYVTLTATCTNATAVRVYRGKTDGTDIKALGYADDLGGGSFSFLDGKYSSTGTAAYFPGTDAQPPIRNNTFIPGTHAAGNVTTDTGSGAVLGTYTGLQLINGILYAEFVFAAHACKDAPQVYEGGVRRSAGELTANYLVPNSTEWNGVLAHPHYVTKNSQRYFPIYVNSQYATSVGMITSDRLAQGETALTANIDGIETVGDGTGTLITNLFSQAQHFAENALAPDRPFNSQDWVGTSPLEFTAVPGLTYVDRDSFTDLATTYSTITGAGAIGAYREDVGAMEALARFCLSGDFNVGENRKGQLMAAREPDGPPVSLVALDDVISITDRSFRISDGVLSEFFNILPYRYGRDLSGRKKGGAVFTHGVRIVLPETDGWRSTADGVTQVEDTASQFNFDQEISAPQMDLHFIADATIALQIVNRVLNRYSFPLRKVQLSVPLSGTSIDLGDIFTITHIEGIGSSGWTNEPLRCIRHTLNPNTNLVTLDAYAPWPNGDRIIAPLTGAFVTSVDGTSWLTVP